MSLNTFIALTTPTSGVGPASDVSTLAEGPTMVTVGPGDGEVVLEISCDGGANFAPVTQSPIPNPPAKVLTSRINRDTADPQDGRPTSTGGVVAQYARARRLNGTGASSVSLGSVTSTKNRFATLGFSPVSTRDMGPYKTIAVCGTYAGSVIVEGSVDGSAYDPVALFDTGASDTRCLEGSYVSMRLKPGSSLPSGSVSVGAGFADGGSIGAGVLQFDSIRVVGTKLVDFDTSGLPAGTIAYVGNDTYDGQNSVHDNYRLVYGEALTTETLGTEVVNSSTFSVDGAQWIRLETINQQAAQKDFWSLDPSNLSGVASDENSGWGDSLSEADEFPLLTMGELVWRTRGSKYGRTVVFHQLSDMTEGSVPLDISTIDGNGYPVWLGKKVQVFPADPEATVTLTSYSAAVPSSNVGVQITISSLPVSFTASGLVGLFIESADGTRVARVHKDLGGKTARITTPTNPDVIGYVPGTPQVFTADEQVRFVSFPRLSCPPFPPNGISYCGISDVTLNPAFYVDYDFGSANYLMARMNVIDAYLKASPTINGKSLQCVGLSSRNIIIAGGSWSFQYCGALDADIYVTSGANFVISHAPWDMQNSRILNQGSSFNTYGPETTLAVFDSPGVAMGSAGQNSSPGIQFRFNPNGLLYGSGNTSYLIAILQGTVALVPFPANCFATTTWPKELLLGTVEKSYSDLPVVDLTTLTGMIHG